MGEEGSATRGEKRRRRCGREGRLTAGRGLCAPRVISNVPGCRDSTLMERVALTPVFARQARRSSGVARASMPTSSTGTDGSGESPLRRLSTIPRARKRPRESSSTKRKMNNLS